MCVWAVQAEHVLSVLVQGRTENPWTPQQPTSETVLKSRARAAEHGQADPTTPASGSRWQLESRDATKAAEEPDSHHNPVPLADGKTEL